MKRIFNVFAVFACAAICCLLFESCNNSAKKTANLVQLLDADAPNPSTIEELTEAIEKYESRADELLAVQEQAGIWYKILATKYIEEEMYGESLAALQKAVQYYPENQNLFYYIGVSAGFMAKASLDFNAEGKSTKHDNYLLLAESGYKRAIELEPDYFRAIYGLSVLYVLEMNQPARAIPLLEKSLELEPKNEEAMMLLGHAHYMTYDYEAAVAMYDKVIAATTSKERKEAATANKKAVLDDMYE